MTENPRQDNAEFDPAPVEAIVRAAESALEVRRRYQFFVWSQSHLGRLIPHQLAACGNYDHGSRDLSFDVFNSVSVEASLMQALANPSGALIQDLKTIWLSARGKPVVIDTADLCRPHVKEFGSALQQAQFNALMVHGISRPQRPQEIESLFVFAAQGPAPSQARANMLELLMPHIHRAWQRVQSVERDVGSSHPTPRAAAAPAGGVTQREREILNGLREGLSNKEIAEQLGISALTVKNHVQKILRKLHASNRTQAVAQAISLQLLERHPNRSTTPADRTPALPPV